MFACAAAAFLLARGRAALAMRFFCWVGHEGGTGHAGAAKSAPALTGSMTGFRQNGFAFRGLGYVGLVPDAHVVCAKEFVSSKCDNTPPTNKTRQHKFDNVRPVTQDKLPQRNPTHVECISETGQRTTTNIQKIYRPSTDRSPRTHWHSAPHRDPSPWHTHHKMGGLPAPPSRCCPLCLRSAAGATLRPSSSPCNRGNLPSRCRARRTLHGS